MKRIILTSILATVFGISGVSQSLNYNDLGILISKNDNYGTARSEAMSGAFGALGGNLNAITINPAGAAVARKSKASITLGVSNIGRHANYYSNTNISNDQYFNATQAGAVLVFNTNDHDWNRFALTLNYRLKSNFDDTFKVEGNEDFINFTKNPNENNNNPYDYGIKQSFYKSTLGQSNEFNFGISAVHNNKLFIGGALNFHAFEFSEMNELKEINKDTNGNILDAINIHETYYQTNGVSLGLGLIYKLNQDIRIGLAYETPTWYSEILEESNLFNQDESQTELNVLGKIDMITKNPDGSEPIEYKTANDFETYSYSFKTPSRLTASGAYIFNKKGLLSIDYTYKNYTNSQFKNGDFNDINKSFNENYRDTHALNIGTEWRFNKVSVRGGYHYEKNPNLILGANTNKDNLQGFSTGLGYKIGGATIDLSYQNNKVTNFYKIYTPNDISVDNNTHRITGTLTLSL